MSSLPTTDTATCFYYSMHYRWEQEVDNSNFLLKRVELLQNVVKEFTLYKNSAESEA